MQSCTLMVILWCLLLCTLSVAQQSFSPPPAPNATVKTPFAVDNEKNAKIEHVKKTIDSPVEDIQWVNDETIFVLSQDGSVYLSTDSGRSWQQQNRHMTTGGATSTSNSIQSVFVSKADHTHVFFLGKTRDNWVTTNGGSSYQHSKLSLSDIRLHPTQKNLVLASGQSDGCQNRLSGSVKGTNADQFCFKRLYISRDFGINWDPLVDYVVQFEWSPAIGHADKNGRRVSDDWIYATVNKEKTGDQKSGFWDKNVDFLISKDFFKSYQVLVPHGNRFLFGEHAFLFVAAVNPQHDQQVFLMISRDNKTHSHFAQAQLPVTLTEHSYTILDTSEGTVFLHVNHQPFGEYAYAGHVYVSDWSGIYYTLSLPYNHRSMDGKCDFEKVEGLEGIYLSNFIDEEDMDKFEIEQASRGIAVEKAGRRNRLRTKTVISFDKGGEWHFLKAPTEDSLGAPTRCEGCSLHLHGITDPHGPFYTTASATGIIMGTGSVGQYLQDNSDQINTYLSRDAGVTWKEVAKGTHIYEFGNHGGLIVMAEDNRATKDIMYSWNEGQTWTKLEVSEELIMIENIVIEPKSSSQAFVVYGSQGATQGVVIYVDFSEMHERECTGHDSPDSSASDYETWTPNDGRLNKCLMGHTMTYTRRKPDHECTTPEDHERPQFVQHCPCVASDFECDYGYQRASKTLVSSTSASDCVKMTNSPIHADPAKHIYYGDKCVIRQTKGYRRVPGDTCVGGANWDAQEISCDSTSSSWTRIIFFILVLIILGFAGVTLFSKSDKMGDLIVKFQLWQRKSKKGEYRPVGSNGAGPETPDDDGLDQNFFLDDDDHQSARLLESDGNTKGKGGAKDAQKAGSKKTKKGSSDKDKEIVFRGLPTSRQTTSEVHAPALAPPPGAGTGSSSNV